MLESAERQNSLIKKRDGPVFGQAFGKAAKHRHSRAADLAGAFHRRHRRMPGGIAASVAARKIDDKHRQIDPIAHHCSEGICHLRFVAPDEGVIVERVRQRHQRAKRLGKACAVVLRNRRPVELPVTRQISRQPGLATGTAHCRQPPSRKPPEEMQDFQNLHHLFRRGDLDHPAARQKGGRGGTVTGQRRGVRAGGLAR